MTKMKVWLAKKLNEWANKLCPEHFENVEAKFSKLLFYATGGEGKTSDSLEQMLSKVDSYFNRCSNIAKLHERAKAINEFAKEHREMAMMYCDDDDQISMKVCEYDVNTKTIMDELKEGVKGW